MTTNCIHRDEKVSKALFGKMEWLKKTILDLGVEFLFNKSFDSGIYFQQIPT